MNTKDSSSMKYYHGIHTHAHTQKCEKYLIISERDRVKLRVFREVKLSLRVLLELNKLIVFQVAQSVYNY